MAKTTKIKTVTMLVVLFLGIFTAGLFVKAGASDAFAAADFITAGESVIITGGNDASGEVSHKGLTLESNAAYAASLNGIFYGDLRLDFIFAGTQGQKGDNRGQYTFKFTDASDPLNYFELKYLSRGDGGGWYTGAEVVYSGMTRSTQYWGNRIYNITGKYNEDYTKSFFGGKNLPSTWFELSWTDNILTVKTDMYQGTKPCAVFDGLYDETLPDKGFSSGDGIYALPLMLFPDGYKISVSSSYAEGTDLCIEKLTADGAVLDFTNALLPSEPECYTLFINSYEITRQTAALTARTGMKYYYKPATYKKGETRSRDVEKVEARYMGADGKTPQAFEDITAYGYFIPYSTGRYQIRYTAVVGANSAGNTASYFIDAGEFFDSQHLIGEITGATAEGGKDNSGIYTHKGLTVTGGTGYSAQLNGTFYGDFRIDFSFAGEAGTGSAANNSGRFTFRFSDARNPSEYFDVEYYSVGVNWYTGSQIVYNGMYRSTQYWGDIGTSSGVIFNTNRPNNTHTRSYFGGNNTPSTFLELKWQGDILSVKPHDYNLNGQVTAKFDGTYDKNAPDNGFISNGSAYGLPLMKFENGYKVTLMSSFDSLNDALDGTDICIEAINSVVLTERYIRNTGVYDGVVSATLLGDAQMQTPANFDARYFYENDPGAEIVFDVKLGGFQTRITEKIYTVTDVDLSVPGTVTLDYKYITAHLTRTLEIQNAPPVLYFASGKGDANIRHGGNKPDPAPVLSEADIIAKDFIEGRLQLVAGTNFEIQVKVPGGSFAAFVSGSRLSVSGLGVYEVKYSVTNGSGQTVNIIRTLKVVDGNVPVISINSAIPETELIKKQFSIPGASVFDGGVLMPGEALTVKAYFNGDEIDIVNGAITLQKAGLYTVVYYAVDSDGNEESEIRNIRVYNDGDKPVFGGITLSGTAALGETVTLPAVRATDEVDGERPVVITVKFGTQDIAVENNTFKIENKGVYTITFTASDLNGNTAIHTHKITVTEQSAGGKKGCKSSAGILSVSAVAAVAALLILTKKERKK